MKKGAYDLGRKALYYVVAAMIIALIFVYTSNALYKYQKKGLDNLHNMEVIGILNKVNSCFYYEDSEIGRTYANTVDMTKFKQENLQKCTDIPIRVTLTMLGKEPKSTTLNFEAEKLRETQKLRRIVTIKDQGTDYEGLLQVEIQK